MKQKSIDYFNYIIMPFIRDNHFDILDEMSFIIEGSVGLGIDDELSDIEAAIYLPDNIWKQNGMLQINLDKLIKESCAWMKPGSGIQVYPLSWMLDGQGENILSGENVQWEKIGFDSLFGLFTLHNQPVWYDKQNRIERLREKTSPDKLPEILWKKILLDKIKLFVSSGMNEVNKCIKRNHLLDAVIPYGDAVKALLEIGFIVCKQYYPYRKHLSWAFNRLPTPISDIRFMFDELLISDNWHERIYIMESIFNIYKDYIIAHTLLPELNFTRIDLIEMPLHDNELNIAGWILDNPNWKAEQDIIMEKTLKLGLQPEAARWVTWWEII